MRDQTPLERNKLETLVNKAKPVFARFATQKEPVLVEQQQSFFLRMVDTPLFFD